MTARPPTFAKASLARLQALACQPDYPHANRAASALVNTVLELEFTRRTRDRHLAGGCYTTSPLGAMEGGTGGGGDKGRPEPMLTAYLHQHRESREQLRARAWLDAVGLPDRLLLAVLIRTGRCDYRGHGPWSAGYQAIAADLGTYAQRLGWPAVRPLARGYKDGKSLANAATSGARVLMKAAETGAYAYALNSK